MPGPVEATSSTLEVANVDNVCNNKMQNWIETNYIIGHCKLHSSNWTRQDLVQVNISRLDGKEHGNKI